MSTVCCLYTIYYLIKFMILRLKGFVLSVGKKKKASYVFRDRNKEKLLRE